MRLLTCDWHTLGFAAPIHVTDMPLRKKVFNILKIPINHKWLHMHTINEQIE